MAKNDSSARTPSVKLGRITGENRLEITEAVAPPRRPDPRSEPSPEAPTERLAAILEISALSTLLSMVVGGLDQLIREAHHHPAAVLRARTSEIVARLLAELTTRVVPAFLLCLVLLGCGGSAEPAPPPALECVAIDLSGFCADAGCQRDMTCNRAPLPGELGADVKCVAVEGVAGRYRCRWGGL